MLRLAWSFLRRDFLLAVSYRAAFGLQVLSIFAAVPIIFFMSQVFAGFDAPSLKPYGGQYFTFLLLGMAFQDFVTLSQSTFTTSIREHQLMGTMEIVMLSPIPVPIILLFSSIWSYIFTSIRFTLYIVIGMAFGFDMSHANLLPFALLFVLSILSFASLGILTAAVTLIIKRGEGLIAFMTAATVALGGVVYPISVLPAPLQCAAKLLPFTYALAGVRKALMVGACAGDLFTEFIALAVFAVILCPLSLWAFAVAVKRAKVLGTLGQY